MPTKTWSEPLVLDLIAEHESGDPIAAVESYAQRLRESARQNELPIDVDLIASCKGIRRRAAAHDFAGRIYVESDGQLVMDLNSSDSPERRRFTCAHEMIHTAFPNFTEEKRYRLDATADAKPVNQEEEYLCDLGAAALLMPGALLDGFDIATEGLKAVTKLSARAEVSLEAAGNRLAGLSTEPVAFMVFEHGHKPADRPALRRGEEIPKQVRLRYARCSESLPVYLPRFKSAEADSPIAKAYSTGEVEHGPGTLPGAPKAGVFEIEARCFGYEDRKRVLAVATPVGD